ncbi:MAG: hypothetical protein U9R79_20445 [Armatimonadota bacterium]|nr:hypothetical protein [Armatimonadota bacterium]
MIVSRHRGEHPDRRVLEDHIASRCRSAGRDVILIPHLYHLTEHSAVWPELRSLEGPLAVASWLHPRPAECVLRDRGVQGELRCAIDLGAAESAGEALSAISEALGPAEGEGRLREIEDETPARWYPVLDRSQCTSCGHCLQFCLFGVYERDKAARVVATSPDLCKPGCPACARICPHGAIMFPLCDEPAIAGAPGTCMEPDAAARRMFYVRTGRRCPVCGEVPGAEDAAFARAGAVICEECGRATEAAGECEEESTVHAEIDALIDALDRATGQRGPGGGGR